MERGHDRRRRRRRRARSPSSRRSGSTSSRRRCAATTSRPCAASSLLAEGRLERGRARCWSASGEAGERAGRPDLAYGGWANAACIASAAGGTSARSSYAERGAQRSPGIPTIEFQIGGPASPTRSRGSAATTRRAPRATARPSSPSGSPRRELALVADHDGGLLALLAGDHERAAELLGRALAGDPPVQRAEARLRRAEALARLGRADEADAEIRAAALEPMRAAHRPGVLVARMAFAQALSARARGDHELAERRLREAEAPLAAPRRPTTTRRASTSPRSSTSGARRSPASSTRPPSSSA